MSLISLSPARHGGRPLTALAAWSRRAYESWRALKNERVLAALSADTLKDIGYPVPNDDRNTLAR